MEHIFKHFWLIFIIVFLLLILPSIFYIVRQQQQYIIERFGKFQRVASPGLNLKIPFIDRIAAKIELRIQQLDVLVETKTKDNVFVAIPVSVQYRVENSFDAYYRLSAPEEQIRSYVFDRVRTTLAALNLDDAFASKDSIAREIEDTLAQEMNGYGFSIINTLVTDINPDKTVRDSMNAINAAQREREAAISLAEAQKIRVVKEAEAEAESKRLQGEGIANQRKAIVNGLVEQFEALKEVGLVHDAQEILLMTQYFDTLVEVSRNSQNKTIMMPSNPGGLNQIMQEMRNSFIVGGEVPSDVITDSQEPNTSGRTATRSAAATRQVPSPVKRSG